MNGFTLRVNGDTVSSGKNQAPDNVVWPSRLIVEASVKSNVTRQDPTVEPGNS
jgi:hypothetical protein